jgi:hypothetical protein
MAFLRRIPGISHERNPLAGPRACIPQFHESQSSTWLNINPYLNWNMDLRLLCTKRPVSLKV